MLRDLGAGIAGIMVGVLFIALSRDLPLFVSKGSPGPSFFPILMALISIICGISLIVRHFRLGVERGMDHGINKAHSYITAAMRSSSFRNMAKFLIATIVYIYLIPYVGFILTSLLYMTSVQVIYRVSIARSLVVSFATITFIYVTFIEILGVVVPEPILGSIMLR